MSKRLCTFLLVASLGVALSPPAPGEAAPGKTEPARTDADGDPLPPGVVARLGSARLAQTGVVQLAFSPNDEVVAALDFDGHLSLWEVRSGKELWSIRTPGNYRCSPFAFSADGKLIAFARADNTIRVCETSTGKERQKLDGLADSVTQLAFDPRGRYLAAACDNGAQGAKRAQAGSVQLLDLDKNKASVLAADLQKISFLAYSADGKTLTALPEPYWRGNVCYQWDPDTGKELLRRDFEIEPSYRGPALSPDGTLYAAPSDDGKVIRLLDPTTGKEVAQVEGKPDWPREVAFSADGKALAGAGWHGNVQVWDTAKGKLQHEFKGLTTTISHIALSHDGKLVALTGREDGAIHLFDVAKGKALHSFAGHRGGPLIVAFSPDGKTVCTTNREWNHDVREWCAWSLRQWDPQTGKELRVTTDKETAAIHHTAFSADGRLLATVSFEGTLRLWDTDSGKELRAWSVPTDGTPRVGNMPAIVRDLIRDVVFSADGKSLMASTGPKVYQWDAATSNDQQTLSATGDSNSLYVFAGPDNRSVLAIEYAPRRGPPLRLRLLDPTTGRVVGEVGRISHPGVCVFSPDGRTLAVTDNHPPLDKTFGFALCEVVSGRERGRFMDMGYVYSLAFSPDGKLLAAGGEDVIRLIHLASGREVGRLEAYRGKVESLAFSPDGKWLAAAGSANTALVCDVAALTADKLPKPAKLTAKELAALWDDLRSTDDAKAYRAVGQLAASAKESAPFLKERLQGKDDLDKRRIAQLIADLDDNAFAVREKASASLQELGPLAEPALRQALEKTESAEVRTRVRALLGKLEDSAAVPLEVLVKLRALEALANCGTPETHDILKELTKGAAETRLTQEAKAALDRLDARKPVGH